MCPGPLCLKHKGTRAERPDVCLELSLLRFRNRGPPVASDALYSYDFGRWFTDLVAQSFVDLADHPHHHASGLLRLFIVRRGIDWYYTFLIRRRASHFDVAVIAPLTKRHVEALHHLNDLLPRPLLR